MQTASRRVVIRLIAIGLVSVVSLALSELMVRTFAPPWLEQRMAMLNPGDARVQGFGSDREWKVERRNGIFFSFTPGSQFDVSNTEYNVTAHIDEIGGRRTLTRAPAGAPVVAMVGDSFTFGTGVEDQETYVSRLAALVPNFRVLNLGVTGSALPEQLEILRMRHHELSLSAVVLFFYLGNDFENMVRYEQGYSQVAANIDRQEEWRPSLLWRLNDFVYHDPILRRSYLIQLVRRFVNPASGARSPTPSELLILDPSQPTYQSAARVNAVRYLTELRDFAAGRFDVLIVAVPSVLQLSATRRLSLAEHYHIPADRLQPLLPNEILEDSAAEVGLSYFDPTTCLAEQAEDASSLYFIQDFHFRSVGNQAYASCLAPEFLRFLGSPSRGELGHRTEHR